MPRPSHSLALSAAVVMSVVALAPRASAEGQETHGVYHTQFENDSVRLVRVRYPANGKVPLHGHPPTVRFTNAQMRIARVAIPAGQMAEIDTTANAPALLIALGEATITADGSALPLQVGQERWVASSRRERLANGGASQIELLRIDVLTRAAVLEPAIAQQRAPSAAFEAVPPAITLPPALDRVLRDYERAWRDGNGPGLAALFTDDGFAVQSGSPIRQGRAAIAQGITRPGGTLQLAAYAFSLSGTVGYIVGGYRYPQSTGPGGRFVLALRIGRGGRWLIAADLDNSPAPPPPVAPVVPAPVVPAASATQASAQPNADARIALRIGESVTPPKSTTTVTFTEVSDDSRCPTNVTCVWAGDAAVTLRVQPATGAAEVVTLHTGLANAQAATAAGLRLELERLEPRPTFGKTLDRSAYVATIAITSSAGAR